MGKYKVNITHSAENDLRDIARYISFQLNEPSTAISMIGIIKDSIAKLEENPFIYQLVRNEHLSALGYRLFGIKNYIVFYIINEKNKTVDIDRILHSRRDWQILL